jgi:hypothetical protein
MTILVDPLLDAGRAWTRHGSRMACHLGTDDHSQRGLLALCDFAHDLGLRDEWLQWGGVGNSVPHFDLTASKRHLAVKAGAVEVDRREMLRRCKWTEKEMGK